MPSSNRNYPIAWHQFTLAERDQTYIAQCGFVCDFGSLSRWAARYRLSKSFRALDLGDAYASSHTPQLYSAIVRIFLVYSAFETYCQAIGVKPSEEMQTRRLQDAQDQQVVIAKIRLLDPQYNLAKFLLKHVNSALQRQTLQSFVAGKAVNVSFLARCVRHIFAHGILSANSSRLSAKQVDQISILIATFLLDCMDHDFATRVHRGTS